MFNRLPQRRLRDLGAGKPTARSATGPPLAASTTSVVGQLDTQAVLGRASRQVEPEGEARELAVALEPTLNRR